MISVFDLVPMITAQTFCPPNLERVPEPEAVMDGEANVSEFDQVLDSKLAIAYAAALDVIYRARNSKCCDQAIDLACGPGQFSIFLSRHLNYKKVVGVDLSQPMLNAAQANASEYNVSDVVQFELGDVTALKSLEDDSFDLATFNDAAHHMPDLETVTRVFSEMERITKPTGMIFIMDLVRLKNKSVTEKYIRTIGDDYLTRGLTSFFEDFRNSMYAAWTAEELGRAVPTQTERTWFQIIPWGLPSIQMLVAVPTEQANLYEHNSEPGFKKNLPLRPHLRKEWKLFQWVLGLGKITQINK